MLTRRRPTSVAADVTSGGAVDTTYTGNVALAFANNPGAAKFVVSGNPVSTITVAAVNGVADFSPIIVNAVGFGDTLTATATGLTSATSNSLDVAGASTACRPPTRNVVRAPDDWHRRSDRGGARFGQHDHHCDIRRQCRADSPLHRGHCRHLTFSGDRMKTITLTIPVKQGSLVYCYGQPSRSSTSSCTRPRTSAPGELASTRDCFPSALRTSPGRA